jgi:dTDP-4-dehydrorhamnose reductase
MNILITWWNGMLWSTFRQTQLLEQSWHTIQYTDHHDFNITNTSQIGSFLTQNPIDLIINCAAYTNVEQAEEELLNYEVNTIWVLNLAKICAEKNIKIIHISTDYVFDGMKKEWYLTSDSVWPLNKYGTAKRLGEQCLLRLCPTAKIVRTSRLYGWWSTFKNFVNTMTTLGETKSELSIINDQRWAPTFTNDLVVSIARLIQERDQQTQSVFQFCNQTTPGWITRYDFAKEIFAHTNNLITCISIPSSNYPTKAQRPIYSRMINDSTIQLPNWKESLHQYLDNL